MFLQVVASREVALQFAFVVNKEMVGRNPLSKEAVGRATIAAGVEANARLVAWGRRWQRTRLWEMEGRIRGRSGII